MSAGEKKKVLFFPYEFLWGLELVVQAVEGSELINFFER